MSGGSNGTTVVAASGKVRGMRISSPPFILFLTRAVRGTYRTGPEQAVKRRRSGLAASPFHMLPPTVLSRPGSHEEGRQAGGCRCGAGEADGAPPPDAAGPAPRAQAAGGQPGRQGGAGQAGGGSLGGRGYVWEMRQASVIREEELHKSGV